MRSINQNTQPQLLPDFRNLGTVMRIVLLVNGLALLAAMAHALSFEDLMNRLVQGSALLQPVLLCALLLLYALAPWLRRFIYWRGALVVMACVAVSSMIIDRLGGELLFATDADGTFRYTRHVLLGICVAIILLLYFRLRAQALTPARQEARLQALQARIRPHFLFNSINAVLSVVRADPKRAETALEDMADMFRMAMAESYDLVPLRQEVALARQYLALETLRLGERLQVNWDVERMPQDALIPPLILQPLLENAVYHGIEPLPQGGTIDIRLYVERDGLHLIVANPAQIGELSRPSGHKMALSNIRERLELLFDLEAQYHVEQDAQHYQVHILVPHVQEASA